MKGEDLSAKGQGPRAKGEGEIREAKGRRGNEKEQVKVKTKWESAKDEGEMKKRK